MSNPVKPKRRPARCTTSARANREIVGDGQRLHELSPRASAATTAIAAAATMQPTPGATDAARAAGRDRTERGPNATGGDDFSVKEESPAAPGTRTPTVAFRITPSEMDGETRSPCAHVDSPDEAVAAASAPTLAEPCRWASLTPSPPPRTAPGLKRQLKEDSDGDLAVCPAAKRRRVTNDPPAGSLQLDPTHAGAHAESPTAATRENESFDTTVARAAVDHFEDAGAQPDEDNNELRSRRSVRGRPSIPFRPRRSARARETNGTRAQSVEAVSIHTPPRRVQPVPRASVIEPDSAAGEGEVDLLALAARFHAHLDHLEEAQAAEEADVSDPARTLAPETAPTRAVSTIEARE